MEKRPGEHSHGKTFIEKQDRLVGRGPTKEKGDCKRISEKKKATKMRRGREYAKKKNGNCAKPPELQNKKNYEGSKTQAQKTVKQAGLKIRDTKKVSGEKGWRNNGKVPRRKSI